MQIADEKSQNKVKFTYAKDELQKCLKTLEDHLKLRTFFVGNKMTLIDVILCCNLDSMFRKVIPSSMSKKLSQLFRWFRHVRSLPPFVLIMKDMELCGDKGF